MSLESIPKHALSLPLDPLMRQAGREMISRESLDPEERRVLNWKGLSSKKRGLQFLALGQASLPGVSLLGDVANITHDRSPMRDTWAGYLAKPVRRKDPLIVCLQLVLLLLESTLAGNWASVLGVKGFGE